MSIRGILEECAERYSRPQRLHGEDSFRFACSVSFVQSGRGLMDAPVDDLAMLWNVCNSAKLFLDVDYGQWGLAILSEIDSRSRTMEYEQSRSEDARPGDAVFGEFLGDSDLLIYARGESGTGRVLVCLPLDPRSDWYPVGDSIEDFLQKYLDNFGKKFWAS